MQRQEAMKRQATSEYFGGDIPINRDTKLPRSDLTFDDQSVSNIASLVFKGMQGSQARHSDRISKDDLRTWTKAIMQKKYPDKEFNEKYFEKGFARIDVNKNGKIDINDIRQIVKKKVKKENLYIGK